MALTPIDQYKYGLRKYLAMHFDSVEMNRGQKETTYYLKLGIQTEVLKIDNSEIESCQLKKTIPEAIKQLCK
jgi:hypothetical protein